MGETIQKQGVLGIIRNAADNACILFPLYCEGEKQEMVKGYGKGLRVLRPHMLEMVSGAVDQEDKSVVAAMQREINEERHFNDLALFGPLEQTLDVQQIRGNRNMDFSVVLFLISLTPNQQESLMQHEQTRVYSDEYLAGSLDMMSEEPFRPLAWAALHVAVSNNFWKQP